MIILVFLSRLPTNHSRFFHSISEILPLIKITLICGLPTRGHHLINGLSDLRITGRRAVLRLRILVSLRLLVILPTALSLLVATICAEYFSDFVFYLGNAC